MPTATAREPLHSQPSCPPLAACRSRLSRGFLTTLAFLTLAACGSEDPGGTGPEVETEDSPAQVLLSSVGAASR
jgi:hypothetical protein